MKSVVINVVIVAAAIILIATKPTPEEIVQAATGKINYVVINKDSMPEGFLPTVAATAIIQGIGRLFDQDKSSNLKGPLSWSIDDLVFIRYTEVTVFNMGSLKCAWLLHNGFCFYSGSTRRGRRPL
jgi:hypothetical protein